jgi:hypothetical protein
MNLVYDVESSEQYLLSLLNSPDGGTLRYCRISGMPSAQDLAGQLKTFNETLPIMWSKKVGSDKRGATQNVHVTTISFHNADKV